MQETLRRWTFMGLLLVLVASLAWAGGQAPASTPLPIAIIPQDGFNLVVDEQLDSHYVIVKLASPAHNWFAGTFTNLPTDKEVTIGLSMAGNDTAGNEGNVKKWEGLRPVMTYADPTKYETYEWFQKDAQGRWISGDPFKKGKDKYAGTGKVPEQSVLPKEVAGQFLSDNGKYWQAWRDIETAEAVPNVNIFRIRMKFSCLTATIAMRVPYTYTYLQAVIGRIKAAQLAGVYVDKIGTTIEGRDIQVIRVNDPMSNMTIKIIPVRKPAKTDKEASIIICNPPGTLPTNSGKVIVTIAREHATEPASSWVVQGVLNALLSDSLEAQRYRKNTTWLLIHVEDLDGSAHSQFDNLTEQFHVHFNEKGYTIDNPSEVLAYPMYLRAFIESGQPIAVATSFHNLECNDGPNLSSPWGMITDKKETLAFNRIWFDECRVLNIVVGDETPLAFGTNYTRLFGWCWGRLGALGLGFEINDRLPGHELTLCDIDTVGDSYCNNIYNFFDTDVGKLMYKKTIDFLIERANARQKYNAAKPKQYDARTSELLSFGY